MSLADHVRPCDIKCSFAKKVAGTGFCLMSNKVASEPDLVGWLCLTSHRQRGHLETAPHLLSLAKDVKLD